jgi:Winged helix DNA-binding domain
VGSEIGRLRLAAQKLVGPPASSPVEVVRWLTAVQAQEPAGALTSVALRTASRRRDDVVDALNAGAVVRSWPMRGTLHLVAAEDLAWMLPVLTPRVITGLKARHEELDLSPADFARAGELAAQALAGGRSLSRAELMSIWEAGGQRTSAQRGYHLLGYLAQTGTLCFGPMIGGEQRIVLLGEWVPEPRTLDRDEALGELAVRYFSSHGPATVKDFTAWGKLLASDVKTALALARPQLATLEVDGEGYFLAPATAERLAGGAATARGVFLLPGFDEFMLGYRNRTAVLAPEFAGRVCPGGNGMFRPTVVADGTVIGTWRREARTRTVVAEGFTPLSPTIEKRIAKQAARLP